MLSTNPILEMLAKKGYEEIIGPLGPILSALEAAKKQESDPMSWGHAVAGLVQAAQAKELAARLPPKDRANATKSATSAIEEILDDWCGTPPRRIPWPWPGPPPWTWQIVSALSLIANSLQAGALRDELLGIAGQAAARASEAGQASHA
jgi:hypothetical protein